MVFQIMVFVGEVFLGLVDCLGRLVVNVVGFLNSRNLFVIGRVLSRIESWVVGRVLAAVFFGNFEVLVCSQGGSGSIYVWFLNAISWFLKIYVRCSIRFLNRILDMVLVVFGFQKRQLVIRVIMDGFYFLIFIVV